LRTPPPKSPKLYATFFEAQSYMLLFSRSEKLPKLHPNRAEGELGGQSYIPIEPKASWGVKVTSQSSRRRARGSKLHPNRAEGEQGGQSYIPIEPKASKGVEVTSQSSRRRDDPGPTSHPPHPLAIPTLKTVTHPPTHPTLLILTWLAGMLLPSDRTSLASYSI
jgi:hypothetical protein